MSERRRPNLWIIGITAAAHVGYLSSLLFVLVCLGGLLLFWLAGSPVVPLHPPATIYRFAAFQIVLFGAVGLLSHVVGSTLEKQA